LRFELATVIGNCAPYSGNFVAKFCEALHSRSRSGELEGHRGEGHVGPVNMENDHMATEVVILKSVKPPTKSMKQPPKSS
jgi:hypothetical protein